MAMMARKCAATSRNAMAGMSCQLALDDAAAADEAGSAVLADTEPAEVEAVAAAVAVGAADCAERGAI